MIRLNIDRISNEILGYEYVNEFLETYSDDIIIDNSIIHQNIIGLYYENGEIINDKNRKKYNSELKLLMDELYQLNTQKQHQEENIINALLNDSLEDMKIEIARNQERTTFLRNEIETLQNSYKEQTKQLYLEDIKKIDNQISPKYYSSICLLIKDENQYLKEWLDHYLSLGFDHIFIYDNNSNELSTVSEIITQWYDNDIIDKITVIPFHEQYNDLQTEAYNHFLEKYGSTTRWVIFLDSDEFLRFPDNDTTINDFLTNMEDYTAIHVDFVEYGADGQEFYEDKPVKERFTTPVTINDGIYFKDFIQPVRITRMRTHYPIYNKNKHCVFEKDKSLVVIDHYYTKSWEEWQNKINRGSCDPNYLKRLNEFFEYNPDMIHLKTNENISQQYLAG